MSKAFRELLRKIGSGPHTGKDLSREEAAAATRMMLLQEATPAQIGAFMIAHRIKRPTGEELAGMLDAYDELGPKLQPLEVSRPVTIFGSPYDGRSRTAPISPITATILAAAGCPSILHGGDRMPTKEGLPLIQIWQALGVDWTKLDLAQVQQVLEATGLGFVYLPKHFPLAQGLVPYREEIGKRPPFATLELIWNPYAGDAHIFCGFVHPPTETTITKAFALRGTKLFTTVKGVEGGCDLPRDRTAILGLSHPQFPHPASVERLHLSARNFGFTNQDPPLNALDDARTAITSVLHGEFSELMQAAIWNAGFYLWRCGVCSDMASGIIAAKTILLEGQAHQKLKEVREFVSG